MTDEAERAKEDGIERAHKHAEHSRPGWTTDAALMLGRYAEHIGAPFLVADARKWAYANGLDLPPNDYSWGAVSRVAAEMGLIHKTGNNTESKSVTDHSLKAVWTPGRAPEKLVSAPHSRRDVLAKALQLKGFYESERAAGKALYADALLEASRMLENLAPHV